MDPVDLDPQFYFAQNLTKSDKRVDNNYRLPSKLVNFCQNLSSFVKRAEFAVNCRACNN